MTIKDLFGHHKLLGRDKLEHFYTASLGFAIFSVLFNPIVASIAVASISLAKELIYDKWLGKGNPEFLDGLMSSLPIILYWAIQL
jgi:hypothetical protein